MDKDRLKYRGWVYPIIDSDGKPRWVYGRCPTRTFVTEMFGMLGGEERDCEFTDEQAKYFSVETDSLEQCTGFRNSEGNLIYEGDKLRDLGGEILHVEWDNESYGFVVDGVNGVRDLEKAYLAHLLPREDWTDNG